MNSANLTKLCETAAALDDRIRDVNQRIASLEAEKAEIIHAATGADDQKAITALNSIASRETLLSHQVEIAMREREGLDAKILNEADVLRRRTALDINQKRDAIVDRISTKLAEFYPDSRDLKTIIQSICTGGSRVPQPLAIRELQKISIGLSDAIFNPHHWIALAYGQSILGLIARAQAALKK